MRSLHNWEIDSLRRQHQDLLKFGRGGIKKGHEVRDDTEPRCRRMLTDEELAMVQEVKLDWLQQSVVDRIRLSMKPPKRDQWDAEHARMRMPTVAEQLARAIIYSRRSNAIEWEDGVLEMCQSALKAQDDIIAHYQNLEMERMMSEPQRYTLP